MQQMWKLTLFLGRSVCAQGGSPSLIYTRVTVDTDEEYECDRYLHRNSIDIKDYALQYDQGKNEKH